MKTIPYIFKACATLTLCVFTIQSNSTSAAPAADLEQIDGVTLVATDWADGDSFRVKFPNGAEHTLRLYGADCIEWHLADDSDARRQRAQRRYFGITEAGGGSQESIALAGRFAGEAAAEVRTQLARPFTVFTSYADARGSAKFKRIYAFVRTADGRDLATLLVEKGLARAFGVSHSTPDGATRSEYIERLKDAELVAARSGRGVWAFTNWDTLPQERLAMRKDNAEIDAALGRSEPTSAIDINSASRDELMSLPGIGKALALRIIEARPFAHVDDLRQVNGIGEDTLERIRPYLK